MLSWTNTKTIVETFIVDKGLRKKEEGRKKEERRKKEGRRKKEEE